MSRSNIFDGDSLYAAFAQAAYKLLTSHKWITYADVMAETRGLKSAKELKTNISKLDGYGELRKAFPAVCKAIKAQSGEESIIHEGNNRNRHYKYTGKDSNPLADTINAKVVNDIRLYWQFCQDSSGFFPMSWLEYFFNGCEDLLKIKTRKQKGGELLTSSMNMVLANIELLPFLYEAVKRKQVLAIEYKPYEEEIMQLVFHPQYLREYNGRWHLLGHAKGKEPEWAFNIALDRIAAKPRELYDVPFKSAPANFYSSFFSDIIGVSHKAGNEATDILIRAHSLNIYKLTETKPMHHSQTCIVPYGEHKDGSYGDFRVHIEVNNEFIGRILQMGDGLEIIAPEYVRKIFADKVEAMQKLYKRNAPENEKQPNRQ